MNERKAPLWPRWHGPLAAPNVTPDSTSAVEQKVVAEIADEQHRAFLAHVTGSPDRRPWHHRS